jgi:membrane protein YdbS with pleckstrin-like domain
MRLFICKPVYSHNLKIIRYSTAVFIFLVLLLSTYFALWENSGAIFLVICAGLVFALAASLYVKITNDAISYEATEGEIVKTDGILTKHTLVVSYSKISNVSTRQDLVDRFFSLGTIFLDTTGGGAGYELTMRHLGSKDMAKMISIIKDMLRREEKVAQGPNASASPQQPFAPSSEAPSAAAQGQPPAKKPPVSELPPSIPDFAASEREHLEVLESEAYLRKKDEDAEREAEPGSAGERPAKPMKKAAKKAPSNSKRRTKR